MTPDLTNFEDRSDRERRRRELELLALLLLLFEQTRTHVYSALRVGADPFQAATDVLMGNQRLHQPGLAWRMGVILGAAHSDGIRRAGLVMGTALPGYAYPAQQQAQQNAGQMLRTLHQRIATALATAQGGRYGAQNAVREAFARWGYSESAPSGAWLLSTVSETAVGQAYGAGQLAGWLDPASEVSGFQYVSVLDNRTSDICLAYDGVRLPVGHRWLASHHPANHFRCRSLLRPLWGRFDATPESDIPWTPAPMPGFGVAPLVAFGRRFNPAA